MAVPLAPGAAPCNRRHFGAGAGAVTTRFARRCPGVLKDGGSRPMIVESRRVQPPPPDHGIVACRVGSSRPIRPHGDDFVRCPETRDVISASAPSQVARFVKEPSLETIVSDLNAHATLRTSTAFIIVRSRRQGYAIPIAHVREVASLPRVSRILNAPPDVRGVINFRDDVVVLVDLRVVLDQPARRHEIDELIQLLRDREQDHRNWLAELEASVREGRPFQLARDPHQCKFGKWYDTYQPDHAALEFIWSSLDRPHKAIHAIADHVLAATAGGDTRSALALIEQSRQSDLRSLVDRLTEATNGLQGDTRELGVILDWDGRKIALGVDSAEAVEDLTGVEFLPLPDSLPPATRRLVTAVMRWPNHEEMVLCLDLNELIARRPAEDGVGQIAA